jgi:hypothetical protein
MHNLTRIRLTADKVLDLWAVRLSFHTDGPPAPDCVEFHRLDMRDLAFVEDPFELWHHMAYDLAESLVSRRAWESGRSQKDRPLRRDA